MNLQKIGINRLADFIGKLLHFPLQFGVGDNKAQSVDTRRHVLEAYSAVFENGKYASGKAHFGVHHRLFDTDNGKAFFARDTRDYVFSRAFGQDERTRRGRIKGIFDINGNTRRIYGEYAFGMKYVCAHIRKFSEFGIRKRPHDTGFINYARISGHKSVHVGPVFVNGGGNASCNNGTGNVGAAARERNYFPSVLTAVKTRNNRGSQRFYLFNDYVVTVIRVKSARLGKSDYIFCVHKGEAEKL